MLWLITAGAMVGYSAYAYAVRALPTAIVATYGYVNPVVAVILGAIVLRERVTWTLLAGGLGRRRFGRVDSGWKPPTPRRAWVSRRVRA